MTVRFGHSHHRSLLHLTSDLVQVRLLQFACVLFAWFISLYALFRLVIGAQDQISHDGYHRSDLDEDDELEGRESFGDEAAAAVENVKTALTKVSFVTCPSFSPTSEP